MNVALSPTRGSSAAGVKRALPRKKPEPLPTERECTSRSCRTKKYRQWRKALTHQQHRRHPGGGGVRSLAVLGKSATAPTPPPSAWRRCCDHADGGRRCRPAGPAQPQGFRAQAVVAEVRVHVLICFLR